MPTVAAVVAALAERTRPEYAADWDPVGLQLGDPGSQADTFAVCHEVTEAVVAALETSPVDLLVTYHPLLFEPVNRIVGGRSPRPTRKVNTSSSAIFINGARATCGIRCQE